MLRGYRRLLENKNQVDARQYRAWLDSQRSTVLIDSVRTDDVREIFRGMVRTWIGCEPEQCAATQVLISLGSGFKKAAELPNFSLPVGGNQVLVDTIAAELGDRVRLGSLVESVSWGDDQVEITYVSAAGTTRLVARRCIVALTADHAAKVLQDLTDEQREALASVRYGRFLVAGMFTEEQGRHQPWDDIYSISTPGLAFQVIFNHAAATRQHQTRKPGGALVCYSGGDRAQEQWSATDDEITELFSRDLCTVFPGLDGMIEDVIIKRQERSVPYWAPGDRPRMRLLREPFGPIALAGDYLGIVPSMAAAAQSADAAQRSLLA
jgi:monoamine oxidase